jgi:hypothetical protein
MEPGSTAPQIGLRRAIARTAALGATAALLALAAFAPAASATEPNPDCDGVNWSASVAAGENPYPMLTVTVKFDGDPGNCSMAFSMASYDTDGPSWPTSGNQRLHDYMTATIDASNPSATLTVTKPDCFGQTDFYLGSTKYDGVEGPLPHYPDVATPYGKISGSAGGDECAAPTEQVQPTPTPTPAPTQQSQPTPTPTPNDQGTGGSGGNTGGTGGTNVDLGVGGTVGITPPPTDTVSSTATTDQAPSLPLILAVLAGIVALGLFLTPATIRRTRR